MSIMRQTLLLDHSTHSLIERLISQHCAAVEQFDTIAAQARRHDDRRFACAAAHTLYAAQHLHEAAEALAGGAA